MTNDQKIAAIEETAQIVGGRVYYGYSGRGMFGRECIGITIGRGDENRTRDAAKKRGISGCMSTDSMGRDVIAYWPTIPCEYRGEDD